jgi:WD40 repeat protein
MQSMWKADSGGSISLSLAAARADDPPDEPDGERASYCVSPAGERPAAAAAAIRSLSPLYVPDEVPYLGPTVVPHHESSVRCVAHRFLQSRKCANAFLGMESGEILSLLDRKEARGSRKTEMETEKLGDHKSPITALLIFRDTLISSDKDGCIRFWDVSESAQVPRLRCVLRAAAQVNAMTVQSMSDILSSAGRKFVCPRSSMLAACLPDALLFSGEEDASLSVWTLSGSTVGGREAVG